MAEQYLTNLTISDLTLEVNPASYVHDFERYGTVKRTINGGIVDVDINGKKLKIEINGLTQSQVEEIKKRTVLRKVIDFIDYIPIAEKGIATRVIQEDLGSETIDSELVTLYIPVYKILVLDYVQTYGNNIVQFKLIAEET
jgi:hypothetical protein